MTPAPAQAVPTKETCCCPCTHTGCQHKLPLCPLRLIARSTSPCPCSATSHHLVPKRPPCTEARIAQPWTKPTSDHPSKRGVNCQSYWDRSCKQLVPSRAVPCLTAQHVDPTRTDKSLVGLGAPPSPGPPHVVPNVDSPGDPQPPHLCPGAAGGQDSSIRTVAAPERAAPSIPGVTEPD